MVRVENPTEAESAWIDADLQYSIKYEPKSKVDLSEKLTDFLNLVFVRFPDRHLPDEEWVQFTTYYMNNLSIFMQEDMKLDEKLVRPLKEIRALLYDLHSGRRNAHIPQGAGTGKDSWEKARLLGRVSALVTLYQKHGVDKTVESACRRAARLLKTKHIVFDSGDLHQELWKYIKNYRKDILRRKRDRHAIDSYIQYSGGWVWDDEAGVFLSEVLSGRELIKLTEQHIIGDFEGRDLRPGGPIP